MAVYTHVDKAEDEGKDLNYKVFQIYHITSLIKQVNLQKNLNKPKD